MELTLRTPAAAQDRERLLAQWVDEYATDVLRLCCMYLKSRADAEDAVQETFLKVWRKMDSFEGRNQCPPKAWIMKVACNVCRDMLRASWRRHECRTADTDALPQLSHASLEDRAFLMDVMALPEKYLAVVLLVYLQGMTMKEAAAAIHASPATVCRRLEKAKKMLMKD